MAHAPLRLGIAGLGTVGVGVIRTLTQNSPMITNRSGREIIVTAVSARNKSKDRGIDLSPYDWEDDPVTLAKRDDVDVFVELMGGSDGPAKAATMAALKSGKDVVTANKAMLAENGHELATLAETSDHDTTIRFEAAVAGGIPVVKALTEGLAGNTIKRVIGVMNGTCNYILTRMETAGLPYEEVFAEADALGYLEADPNLDVGGIDAGHKLALLTSIAFGTQVDFKNMVLEGIGAITIDDINAAAEMGYRIKLLGVAQTTAAGVEQRMTPCLVPANSPLGQLEGGTNMVMIEGDQVGTVVLRGAGAGEGPTASAVVGDIIDIARGIRVHTFGQPVDSLIESVPTLASPDAPYYIRLSLRDKPGALADVTTVLGENQVSIDRMLQGGTGAGVANCLFVTHDTNRQNIDAVLTALAGLDTVAEKPVALRIEPVPN